MTLLLLFLLLLLLLPLPLLLLLLLLLLTAPCRSTPMRRTRCGTRCSCTRIHLLCPRHLYRGKPRLPRLPRPIRDMPCHK